MWYDSNFLDITCTKHSHKNKHPYTWGMHFFWKKWLMEIILGRCLVENETHVLVRPWDQCNVWITITKAAAPLKYVLVHSYLLHLYWRRYGNQAKNITIISPIKKKRQRRWLTQYLAFLFYRLHCLACLSAEPPLGLFRPWVFSHARMLVYHVPSWLQNPLAAWDLRPEDEEAPSGAAVSDPGSASVDPG